MEGQTLTDIIENLKDVHRYEGWEFYKRETLESGEVIEEAYKVKDGMLITPDQSSTQINYIGCITGQRFDSYMKGEISDALEKSSVDQGPRAPTKLLYGESVEPHEGGALVIGVGEDEILLRLIHRIEKPIVLKPVLDSYEE